MERGRHNDKDKDRLVESGATESGGGEEESEGWLHTSPVVPKQTGGAGTTVVLRIAQQGCWSGVGLGGLEHADVGTI